jgi:hypothetical protein
MLKNLLYLLNKKIVLQFVIVYETKLRIIHFECSAKCYEFHRQVAMNWQKEIFVLDSELII